MIFAFIIISFLIIIGAELFYIPIARRNNWTSERNNRTDGHPVTVVGGGFIFYLAMVLWSLGIGWLYEVPQTMSNFTVGLTMLAACSFADDLLQLKVWMRLVVHFIAVLFLCFQFYVFELPLWIWLTFIPCAIGLINGYNFMDGINGITAAYSITVLSIFLWITLCEIHFISGTFIFFALISALIFAFFNFRKRAVIFAGDVGSIVMGYIVTTILTYYILSTSQISGIVFVIVYGIDTLMTILRRLCERENIFQPHHKHIYQLLNIIWGCNQLAISVGYALLQAIISITYLYLPEELRMNYFLIVSVSLSALYLIIMSASLRHTKRICNRQG